jgi:hypothetical protein
VRGANAASPLWDPAHARGKLAIAAGMLGHTSVTTTGVCAKIVLYRGESDRVPGGTDGAKPDETRNTRTTPRNLLAHQLAPALRSRGNSSHFEHEAIQPEQTNVAFTGYLSPLLRRTEPPDENPWLLSGSLFSHMSSQSQEQNECTYPIENRHEDQENGYHYWHDIYRSSIRYDTEIKGEYGYQ